MVPKPIRSRIPERLDQLGQTQQWLADMADTTKQQISEYASMKSNPSIARARQLRILLKLKSIDDLWVWRRGE